jgi:hypothetical protein
MFACANYPQIITIINIQFHLHEGNMLWQGWGGRGGAFPSSPFVALLPYPNPCV